MRGLKAGGDLELLEAWRGGDQEAGATLYQRYFSLVRNLVRGKTTDEEDVLQRVFESLVRVRNKLEVHTSFRAYLVAITRNELVRSLRERARDPHAFDPSTISADSVVPSPSEAVAWRAEQRALLSALVRIPLDSQIIVELHYWESMSTAELGEAFGVPRSTIKTRIQRARQQLQEQLRTLAIDPEVVERTTQNLERWARSIRQQADWELDR